MFKIFKEKLGKWQLKKAAKNRHHKAVSINWNEIQSMGILYDGNDESNFRLVKHFVEQLNPKVKVKTLGYVNQKELDDFHIQSEPYRFFCNADLNWYFKPQSEFVKSFIYEPFDLLINLCGNENILPLEFVLVQTHARFIAGGFDENSRNDLMIDTNSSDSNKYLLEQIVHYLKMIKTK